MDVSYGVWSSRVTLSIQNDICGWHGVVRIRSRGLCTISLENVCSLIVAFEHGQLGMMVAFEHGQFGFKVAFEHGQL